MHRDRLRTAAPWGFLVVLHLLLIAAAATLDRSDWPVPLLGDEASYRMQAESLAFDFDLRYAAGDHARFLEHHGLAPDGIILQSGDGGVTIAFGKPFFYALYLAPFARLAPERGPYVANALLLALASLLTAHSLRPRVGEWAPLWSALFVFASASFAQVFWVHPDLFLMCLVAVALALAFDPRADGEAPRRAVWRWMSVGLLLTVVVYSRPFYLPILLPAFLAARALDRPGRRALLATAAGTLLLVLASAAVHQALAGTWTSYGGARSGFYSHTGFPDVDFPRSAWNDKLDATGNRAWAAPEEMVRGKRLVPSLLAWNALYTAVGRNVGFLPYFFPLVLGFLGRPRGAARWSLVLAFALTAFVFAWLRPFNFYGGGGALANRYLLPLYPAFWFLATRPVRGAWLAAVGALAGLFLTPLWATPRAYPLAMDGAYHYVSPTALALLPFETTQQHLKPTGRWEVLHHGLWVKFLTGGARPDDFENKNTAREIKLDPGREETLLIGRATPLEAIEIVLDARPGAKLTAPGGGRLVEIESGRRRWRLRLELGRPRAVHPMWWTDWRPYYLYEVDLRLEQAERPPGTLRLRAAQAEKMR